MYGARFEKIEKPLRYAIICRYVMFFYFEPFQIMQF